MHLHHDHHVEDEDNDSNLPTSILSTSMNFQQKKTYNSTPVS